MLAVASASSLSHQPAEPPFEANGGPLLEQLQTPVEVVQLPLSADDARVPEHGDVGGEQRVFHDRRRRERQARAVTAGQREPSRARVREAREFFECVIREQLAACGMVEGPNFALGRLIPF